MKSEAAKMKTSFVRIYLAVTAVLLFATAVAKYPAIFHARTWCSDPDILTKFQLVSNERLLGFAAGTELAIVALILFSPWRWLPCLAAAAWSLLCFGLRLFLMNPYANCRCLGWLAKPGPTTNLIAAIIALLLAGGGWLAFRNAWRDEKPTRQKQTPPA
jgi:hypothetical protein